MMGDWHNNGLHWSKILEWYYEDRPEIHQFVKGKEKYIENYADSVGIHVTKAIDILYPQSLEENKKNILPWLRNTK